MADENAITIPIPIPDGDPLWTSATPALRSRYYQHAADQARVLKLRRLRRGLDYRGRPMAPVKPKSRPDGATGPPLSPHQPESRTQKWIRASISQRNGTVTLWWSHGWGQILGYHQRELRPRRMVIGFQEQDQAALAAECRRFWRLIRTRGAPPARTVEPIIPSSGYSPSPPYPMVAKGM